MTKLTLSAHIMLSALVACSAQTENNGNVIHYEIDEDAQLLLTEELALSNKDMVDANSNPAFMASQSGIAYIEANPEFVETETTDEALDETYTGVHSEDAPKTVGGFVIHNNVKLPRTRTRSSKYPFAQLDVGQGFAIPVGFTGIKGDEEPNEEPWKTMQSAVSAANRQYKDGDGVSLRKFKQARVVVDEANNIEGSMVTRIAVEPREVQLEKIANRKAKAAAAAAAKAG